MKGAGTTARTGAGEMHKRRTTLDDGRYLIYYTFDDEGGELSAKDEAESKRAPDAEPIAEEEERRV